MLLPSSPRGGHSRRRGVFLVEAMVLVMIMAILATGMLWLAFGRHVLLNRVNTSEAKEQMAAGARSMVLACLDGTPPYGQMDCTTTPATYSSCMLNLCGSPCQIGNPPHAITVKFTGSCPGTPPNYNCTCQPQVIVDPENLQ